jgi:hypothetical protein
VLDLLSQFLTSLVNIAIDVFELGAIFGISYGVIKGISWLFSTASKLVAEKKEE